MTHIIFLSVCSSYFNSSNNPLARKHQYRPTLIRRIPSLSLIDGKEITADERERTDPATQGGKTDE